MACSRTRILALLSVSGLVAATAWGATPPTRPSTEKSSATTNPRSATPSRSGGSAKGVLPDPVLLDGSSQPAEKRPEHGMVGDFELPGDENAKTGRVGGPQSEQ